MQKSGKSENEKSKEWGKWKDLIKIRICGNIENEESQKVRKLKTWRVRKAIKVRKTRNKKSWKW